MLFSTNYLNEIFGSKGVNTEVEVQIEEVMTDSRKEVSKALFIPIIGERFDGHDYLDQAIANGAVASFWDESISIPEYLPESFILYFVKDTTVALQQLAKSYRNLINPTVIGITGSNGKTTTKDILASLMKTKYTTHYTKGNFNNHIGLPLTILQMKRNTDILIVEMGMNAFHEISLLTHIARPDYAIITNIGESHIENLGSREGIAKAKLEITEGLKNKGFLIKDGDEPLLIHHQNDYQLISCGFHKENTYVLSSVTIGKMKTNFVLNDKEVYNIPLLGEHHAKNATLAIAVAKELGLSEEQIRDGLDEIEHTSMRFERFYGRNNVTIINDAYNASATSMIAAIKVMKQLDGFKQKVLVLGDILELGEHSHRLHRSVANEISPPIDIVYTFGKDAKVITTAIQQSSSTIKARHFQYKEDLILELENYLHEQTVILFKASRGLAFEKLIEQLV